MNAARDPDAAALAVLGTMVLSQVGGGYGELKSKLRSLLLRDPLDTVLVTVLGGAWLFYLAEKDENPKVQSFADALVFVSTCLSVGYADTFARTPSGKAIATVVMTLGPALSSRVLEEPAGKSEPPSQDALLKRLDRLTRALEAAQPAAAQPPAERRAEAAPT